MPLTLLANPKQLPDPQANRARPPVRSSRTTPAGRLISARGAAGVTARGQGKLSTSTKCGYS